MLNRLLSLYGLKSFWSLVLLILLSGCSGVEPVAAWERGYLSRDDMRWDSQGRERKLEGHVYTSKEGSSGSAGASGGGCGCN